ncbi:MAG: hypothetical protein DU489_13795 [Nitrosomonas sp.]
MLKNIKEFFCIVYLMFKLRDKTLTEDQLDILMFGDLKTADERLGRVRGVSYILCKRRFD